MASELSHAVLNPQLWRVEAARRRRQLEEMQRYLRLQEQEFDELAQRVRGFRAHYSQRLGPIWAQVQTLQAQLEQALQALARHRGESLPPPPRDERHHTLALPELPPAPNWPEAPDDDHALALPPSLKELHRRAAMRLHPDRARNESDRRRREGLMRDANLAFADEDRGLLESLLIAAGESPQRLGSFDVPAYWTWLDRCERLANARLRVVRAHLVQLRQHPSTLLAQAVESAERQGIDTLALMHSRLQAMATDLRRHVYIGQRLRTRNTLASRFLAQWSARWRESASVQPLYPPVRARRELLAGHLR